MSDWKNKTKEIIANIGAFKDQIIKTVNELKDRVETLEAKMEKLAAPAPLPPTPKKASEPKPSKDSKLAASAPLPPTPKKASEPKPSKDSKPSLRKKP